jgi:GT2 family glycosyltransferase
VKIGVGIPTYRNPENLRRCLNSIAVISPALAVCIVVVDDSGDGSAAAQLAGEFPQVIWIVHEQNLGFGASANECVLACPADVVIMLNDDVEFLTDPIPHLQKAFSDESVFAATFQSVLKDKRFREGAKRLVWRMGFPRILHNPEDQMPPVKGFAPSAYAVGGHAAFRKQPFMALGGFDPLFAPFYWEDADLGERARREGWRIVYLPECQVMHDGTSAIRSRHDAAYLNDITQRNRLLFAWRHARGLRHMLYSISLAYHFLLSFLNPHNRFRTVYRAARERYEQFR